MKNYLVIDNNNRAFEAFDCVDEKDATKMFLNSFIPEDHKMKKIFEKASSVLSVDEMITLFFELFDWYVDDNNRIKNIYSVGDKAYER